MTEHGSIVTLNQPIMLDIGCRRIVAVQAFVGQITRNLGDGIDEWRILRTVGDAADFSNPPLVAIAEVIIVANQPVLWEQTS